MGGNCSQQTTASKCFDHGTAEPTQMHFVEQFPSIGDESAFANHSTVEQRTVIRETREDFDTPPRDSCQGGQRTVDNMTSHSWHIGKCPKCLDYESTERTNMQFVVQFPSVGDANVFGCKFHVEHGPAVGGANTSVIDIGKGSIDNSNLAACQHTPRAAQNLGSNCVQAHDPRLYAKQVDCGHTGQKMNMPLVEQLPSTSDANAASMHISQAELTQWDLIDDVVGEEKENATHHTDSSGGVYSGEMVDKQKHGYGTMTWPDGGCYKGEWIENNAHGEGRCHYANGDVYEGQWVDNHANGVGAFFRFQSSTYHGQFVDSKKDGNGTEIWHDGTKYIGEYRKGRRHGTGLFKWADGSSYDGQFIENEINGSGHFKWGDGREYVGEWAQNRMHGSGSFTREDGCIYEGQYYYDHKHGHGVFKWPDGRAYDGEWKDGCQHGSGTFVTAEGKTRQGEWECGEEKG